VVYRNPEFLGATSYTSILKENLINLGVPDDLGSSEIKKTPIGRDRIAQGCRVLSMLVNRRMINSFVSRWYETLEGSSLVCIEPIVKAW
jgi:hypothetical protein